MRIFGFFLKKPMPRRARHEKRIIQEQETVGMQREIRKEMDELSGKKKKQAPFPTDKRVERLAEKEAAQPRRIARPGKPLRPPGR